ncbi:MAG: APC family permease [Chloroflexi bacterium]|nr:APC family permease [Chloroflexota bacterium]
MTKMADTRWRPKPGDRVFHPRRITRPRLRRILGIPGLFSIGYGDVGSSIYYALGVTALVALGATPIALGIAGVIYIFNALTYAEGSAMIPEGGGSASYARLAFNDMAGFASGWVLMLSYIVTVAISAYTIPPYLSHFWPVLSQPVAGTFASMGIVVFLLVVNVIGIKESSGMNVFFIAVDIITQITLVMLGVVLLLMPNPGLLVQNMFGEGNWPSASSLIFGIAIAALCFTGVESVSQHGEETRQPEKKMPRTYILMVVTVLVLFAGISLVALTAMTPQELGDPVNGWARDPVAGIASAVSTAISPEEVAAGVPSEEARIIIVWLLGGVRELLPALVALLAATILLTATNAGLLGISRLTYNLSTHRQLPATLGRVHHHFRTPYIAIILFSLACLMILIPGFFSQTFFADLGALYVFGSLLTFAIAHAAILRLRMTKPELHRPFRLGGNLRIGGWALPLTAILGMLGTAVIWVVVIIIQPYSRWAGLSWLAIGFIVYYIYRKSQRMSLFHADKPPVPPDEQRKRET